MNSSKLIQFICVLSSLILLLCLACSKKSSTGNDDYNDTAEASIGPAGGSLLLDDDIVLSIQAGLLTETIDFSIATNNSPPSLSGALKFVSPVFTIGPSGTDFLSPASVAITYNPNSCGSFPENSIKVYSHNGTSWEALTTSVATSSNVATGSTSHLSNFAAIIDTTITTEGAFVAMAVGRTLTNLGQMQTRLDLITARFDTLYAPCNPVSPVQVEAVTCNEYTLDWESNLNSYEYFEVIDNPQFIELGDEYIFTITGNSNVPSFVDTIDFPINETYITSPSYYGSESLSGFDVVWESGDNSGTVYLFLMDSQNDTTVFIETDNDGAHSFSSSSLSGLSGGQYFLLMIHENWDYITADGIDPRSFIRARVINITPITLN